MIQHTLEQDGCNAHHSHASFLQIPVVLPRPVPGNYLQPLGNLSNPSTPAIFYPATSTWLSQ